VILAADIGGTNARLGLFELNGPTLRSVTIRRYPSRGHASIEAIVERFLAEVARPVEAACFAVAGPVSEGRVVLTNLGWTVDARRLAQAVRLDEVRLINDLEGIAHGLDELAAADVALLHPGAPGVQGNRAIIAAGTGLGEAGAYWDGRRHHPFACEGGHADFGPRAHLEVDLLTSMLARHDRVSYERVLSGSGLYELYRFLRDSGHGEEPPWLTRELEQDPGPVVIVRAALERHDALCLEAVDLFVSIYGAEAGNLALKVMARGGVWIAGGIAPRILPRMKEPVFRESFLRKGRMRPLLAAMPVRLILNDMVGLIGAARYASAS
jgi:glucokinase